MLVIPANAAIASLDFSSKIDNECAMKLRHIRGLW